MLAISGEGEDSSCGLSGSYSRKGKVYWLLTVGEGEVEQSLRR